MQATEQRAENREVPGLKEVVREASRALARLDADRLEEMALSCQALNRDLDRISPQNRAILATQAKEAMGDMKVFARILEITRDNLVVMNRIRDMRANRLEYGEKSVRGWVHTENGHGDH